jgi:hypothetical protein
LNFLKKAPFTGAFFWGKNLPGQGQLLPAPGQNIDGKINQLSSCQYGFSFNFQDITFISLVA